MPFKKMTIVFNDTRPAGVPHTDRKKEIIKRILELDGVFLLDGLENGIVFIYNESLGSHIFHPILSELGYGYISSELIEGVPHSQLLIIDKRWKKEYAGLESKSFRQLDEERAENLF